MSKRLNRISSNQIEANKAELVGKKVNLVFKSASVLFGTLLKIEKGIVYFKNVRNKKSTHPINELAEIVIDRT